MRAMTKVWAAVAVFALGSLAGCDDDAGRAMPKGEAEVQAEIDPQAAQQRADEKAAYDAAFQRALTKAQATKGPGRPSMWTLKDSDTTLHFIGTVHMLKAEQAWRSSEIDGALARANKVVFELDMSSADAGRAVMAFFSEEGMADDGRMLTSRMNAAEAEAFKAAAAKADLPYEALEALEPWYAAMTLTSTYLQKIGYDPAAGVDTVLENEARAAGKALGYLETPKDQLGRLADLPDDEQVGFLISTVDGLDTFERDMGYLTGEWADGDAAGLAALLTEPELMGSEALNEAFMIARNRDWVPKIEAMLNEPGTALIAVGAAHLVGEDSVIDLLREKGHTVSGP